MKKRVQILLFAAAALVTTFFPANLAKADTASVTKIYEAADLEKLKLNPSGDYILVNDIDMKGVDWNPIDFSGSLDGDGHAIMNLEVTSLGSTVKASVDGNMKEYDTVFSGFFGVLENATIKNLSFLGANIDVTAEQDSFVAILAGYSYNTKIDNCTIEGSASLTVTGKMFGVGGVIGFGGKTEITNSNIDVTLINIDVDAATRDEQFLGGIYGNGYIDVDSCYVKLNGYTSDHGYVHDGGVTGMYILYDATSHEGFLTNIKVDADSKIHFFEDNTNRRAYCRTLVGETMHWVYEIGGNSGPDEHQGDFGPRTDMADEHKTYDTNLLPHYCENPTYTSEEVKDGNYTYTLKTCSNGDYSYKTDYVATREHIADPDAPVEEPSESSSGSQVQPEASVQTDDTLSMKQVEIIIVVLVVLIILLAVLLIVRNQKEKKRKARRKARRK